MQDKTVLVTGASRGIGAAIAQHFQQQGAQVIGTATSEKGKAHLESQGLIGNVLDVSDTESIKHFFEQLKADQQMPDILINNAGITRDNLMMRMGDTEWSDVIDANLSGVFKVTRQCLRHMMKKRWGRIISIGSVVGSMGNPGQANYCAAKAGVIGMSKSLAYEVANRNITVNVIAPGFIETDMTNQLTEDQKSNILQNVPMQAMGKPSDIAETATFLASTAANYITGQTIHVNGGLWMP